MIDFTGDALKAFKEKLLKRKTPTASIRIGVKGSGCNGYRNVIEFEDGNPRMGDYVIICGGGLRFMIDAKSSRILKGSIVDWKNTLMFQGFEITNPNTEKKCGCGESYSLKNKDE